jgi:tetratricopeptide (TPR) repeat protein
MKWRILLFCFGLFCLISETAKSQSSGFYDSLNIAREYMQANKAKEALVVLKHCERNYPNNLYLMQLMGQVLYWSKDIDGCKNYMRAAIQRNPAEHELKLDFARILVEIGDLEEAKHYLSEYQNANPNQPEALLLSAKTLWWLGEKPAKIMAYLNTFAKLYPGNPDAIALRAAILESTSHYLKLGSSYYRDSQPMRLFLAQGELGFYHSGKIRPSLHFQNGFYQDFGQVRQLSAALDSHMPKTKTSFQLRGGMLQNTLISGNTGIGGLKVSQNLGSNWEARIALHKEAYLYTLRSLNQTVNPTHFQASVGRLKEDSWSGDAHYSLHQFDDQNKVHNFSFWILFPLINVHALKIEGGYALQWANSDQNRFVLEDPIEQFVPMSITGPIPGVFDPYFTPQNLRVNALLAKFTIKLSRNVELVANHFVGVWSKIDNPNYFTYPDADGNQGLPIRVFVPTSYVPLDLNYALNVRISDKIRLSSSYQYFKTIFFDSHSFHTGLKIQLRNEKN